MTARIAPPNNPSVVVFGPRASGKTRNSQALARHFGLSRIIEADDEGYDLVERYDCLVLSVDPDKFRGICAVHIPIEEALALLPEQPVP